MEGHHGQALGEEDPHHGRRHLVVNQVPQPQLRNLTNDHVHICKDPFEIQIFEGGLEQEQGGGHPEASVDAHHLGRGGPGDLQGGQKCCF